MNWKDISSYSRYDEAREPVTFTLQLNGLKLVVTRHIHHAPDAWVLTCQPWFEQREVSKGTADEAKATALTLVRSKLAEATDALNQIEAVRERLNADNRDGERHWRHLCGEQGWHVETQAVLFENYVREKGLFADFVESARSACAEEIDAKQF